MNKTYQVFIYFGPKMAGFIKEKNDFRHPIS